MNWYFSALKKYVQFNGRARRREYWIFVLANIFVFYPFVIISMLMAAPLAIYVFWAALILPTIAVAVRRMHDVNKSGWYILIPLYNLILALTPGTIGDNQYGPDPKIGTSYEAQDYERPYDIN